MLAIHRPRGPPDRNPPDMGHSLYTEYIYRLSLTLRLRQASHEKALFRGRLALEGTSAMPELLLLGSTTIEAQERERDSDAPWEEYKEREY